MSYFKIQMSQQIDSKLLSNKLNNRGWNVQYKIAGTSGWVIAGSSRAAESTGFYIIQAGIFLDAGMVCREWKNGTVLLTHNHLDHAGQLPNLLRGWTYFPTTIGSKSSIKRAYEFTKASQMMKISEGELKFNYKHADEKWDRSAPLVDVQFGCWVPVEAQQTFPLSTANVIKQYNLKLHDWSKKQIEKGGMKSQLYATAIQCFHEVDSVGYVMYQEVKRLRSDLKNLSNAEIAAKAKSGEQVNEVVKEYKLAYLCDTSIEVFDVKENNDLIWKAPAVMIECTFLEKEMESKAKEDGHICWSLLSKVVDEHPETEFILFHFSLRYTDVEIKTFFNQLPGGKPSNVKLWLDEEVY